MMTGMGMPKTQSRMPRMFAFPKDCAGERSRHGLGCKGSGWREALPEAAEFGHARQPAIEEVERRVFAGGRAEPEQ